MIRGFRTNSIFGSSPAKYITCYKIITADASGSAKMSYQEGYVNEIREFVPTGDPVIVNMSGVTVANTFTLAYGLPIESRWNFTPIDHSLRYCATLDPDHSSLVPQNLYWAYVQTISFYVFKDYVPKEELIECYKITTTSTGGSGASVSCQQGVVTANNQFIPAVSPINLRYTDYGTDSAYNANNKVKVYYDSGWQLSKIDPALNLTYNTSSTPSSTVFTVLSWPYSDSRTYYIFNIK